jgi:hypothetical protein
MQMQNSKNRVPLYLSYWALRDHPIAGMSSHVLIVIAAGLFDHGAGGPLTVAVSARG